MSKCCIGLCVKDSERGLIDILRNVNKIRECFSEIIVIVAYDESKDNSINILEDYKKDFNDIIIIKLNNTTANKTKHQIHTERTSRIANARNEILERIRKSYKNWEFFIMMDTNFYSCVTEIDTGVLNKVLESDEWDGLSFNRNPYYDLWALSIPPLNVSCWHFYNVKKSISTFDSYITETLSKKKDNEFIPVISAFGGFAIYRTAKFINCHYSGDFDIKMFSESSIRKQCKVLSSKLVLFSFDCEHRSFHVEAIRKNDARIMISTLHLFPNAKDVPSPEIVI